MTTNHKPATPLPWKRTAAALQQKNSEPMFASFLDQCKDADYIAHAANAYPRLVEALRETARALSWHSAQKHAMGGDSPISKSAKELLRELGEE